MSTTRDASLKDVEPLEDGTFLLAGGKGLARTSDNGSLLDEIRTGIEASRLVASENGRYWVAGFDRKARDRHDPLRDVAEQLDIVIRRLDSNFDKVIDIPIRTDAQDYTMDMVEDAEGILTVARAQYFVEFVDSSDGDGYYQFKPGPTRIRRVQEVIGDGWSSTDSDELADGEVSDVELLPDSEGNVWAVGISDTSCIGCAWNDFYIARIAPNGSLTELNIIDAGRRLGSNFHAALTHDDRVLLATFWSMSSSSGYLNSVIEFDAFGEIANEVVLPITGDILEFSISSNGDWVFLYAPESRTHTLAAFDSDGTQLWEQVIATAPRVEIAGGLAGITLIESPFYNQLQELPDNQWLLAGTYGWQSARLGIPPVRAEDTRLMCTTVVHPQESFQSGHQVFGHGIADRTDDRRFLREGISGILELLLLLRV